ncbi:MAG: sigma-70 family RNA polymerase sigma factor [Acidimicrobiales bacterium]|nr:sigma-70 family RNA polymerase sigma factor [Acidimicrobiales bacterium]MDP6902398.1 sigma-70 family RNA polymerase sigma factor [Acidimicrobiales bacterium]HJL98093.1 sigma-70 family RNA polymerase sigma factor [Acidimicrobiales bacterium]
MEELADLDQQVVSMVMEVGGRRVAEDPQRPSTLRSNEAPLPADRHRDFDTFYAANRDQIARALSLSLRNPDLGAEAADEAFVRACQRWAEVSTFANPQGWVYRVAMNWARSWLRRARREREKRPLLVKAEFAEDKMVDVDLERALESLAPAHRTVVVARFFMEWSVEETAEALGIRPGTVKSRLSRALNQLAGELGESPTFAPASDREDKHLES